MGDVINIFSAKKGKAKKPKKMRTVDDALRTYGHLSGSEVQKKRIEWLKKDDESIRFED